MTKIPDEVVERALSVKTAECPEGLQYVLIRGLHAMGFQQCSSETWDLLRAAGEVFVAWERDRFSAAVYEYASEHGKQECCGHGVNCGDHEECCGQPLVTVDFQEAISFARSAPEKE